MVDTVIESRRPDAGAEPQDATARLREVIGQIRASADPASGMAALEPALRPAKDGWREVRRLLVSPDVKEGKLASAIAALETLVAVYPTRVDDRRLLASLLGRLEQWDRAIAEADAAAGIEPGNASLHAARIQMRVQAGRVPEAAEVARTTLPLAQSAPEDAYAWMMAFVRNGDVAEASGIAASLDPDKLPNERVATMAVRALLADGRTAAAIRLGDGALGAGQDCAALRSSLGLAHLRRGTEDDRKTHALTHFEAGLQAAPDDVRLLTLHGETLLRAGRYKDSVAPLARAIELAPELEQTRGLYARALRYTLQYDAAAEQMMFLLKKSPDNQLWQRSAIGALSQAGRKDEAEALFEQYVAKRGAR